MCNLADENLPHAFTGTETSIRRPGPSGLSPVCNRVPLLSRSPNLCIGHNKEDSEFLDVTKEMNTNI
jgi:hypothetical protein